MATPTHHNIDYETKVSEIETKLHSHESGPKPPIVYSIGKPTILSYSFCPFSIQYFIQYHSVTTKGLYYSTINIINNRILGSTVDIVNYVLYIMYYYIIFVVISFLTTEFHLSFINVHYFLASKRHSLSSSISRDRRICVIVLYSSLSFS